MTSTPRTITTMATRMLPTAKYPHSALSRGCCPEIKLFKPCMTTAPPARPAAPPSKIELAQTSSSRERNDQRLGQDLNLICLFTTWKLAHILRSPLRLALSAQWVRPGACLRNAAGPLYLPTIFLQVPTDEACL